MFREKRSSNDTKRRFMRSGRLVLAAGLLACWLLTAGVAQATFYSWLTSSYCNVQWKKGHVREGCYTYLEMRFKKGMARAGVREECKKGCDMALAIPGDVAQCQKGCEYAATMDR